MVWIIIKEIKKNPLEKARVKLKWKPKIKFESLEKLDILQNSNIDMAGNNVKLIDCSCNGKNIS